MSREDEIGGKRIYARLAQTGEDDVRFGDVEGESGDVDHLHVYTDDGRVAMIAETVDADIAISFEMDEEQALAMAGALYDAATHLRAGQGADVVLENDLAGEGGESA